MFRNSELCPVVLVHEVGRGLDLRVVDTDDTDYLRTLNRGSYFCFNLGVGGQDGPFSHGDLWESSDDLVVDRIIVEAVHPDAIYTQYSLGCEVGAHEEREF